jgi:hypothetical protein
MLSAAQLTEEGWAWWFEGGPSGIASGYLLDAGGEIVGHLGCASGEAWVEMRRVRLATGGFGWVKRGYQGVGGFKLLVGAFLESAADEFEVLIGFATPRVAKHYRNLGLGTPIGILPGWGSADDAFSSRSGLEKHALRGAARCFAWLVSRGPTFFVRVEPLLELGDEVDALAEASAGFAPCIRVRDSAYLQWRWRDMPGEQGWEVWAARDRRGRLLGWVVFGQDPRSTQGLVTDILATNAGATRALLRLAVRRLREQNCSTVRVPLHDERPWVKRALLRSGLLPRRSERVVITNAFSSEVEQLTEKMSHWYLTLGDVDEPIP